MQERFSRPSRRHAKGEKSDWDKQNGFNSRLRSASFIRLNGKCMYNYFGLLRSKSNWITSIEKQNGRNVKSNETGY